MKMEIITEMIDSLENIIQDETQKTTQDEMNKIKYLRKKIDQTKKKISTFECFEKIKNEHIGNMNKCMEIFNEFDENIQNVMIMILNSMRKRKIKI